ncbi:MAG TPA: metallophosphoesterase family protein [Polyangiaceae bacterium]|nr:metallophosphoesterase family protein [Polyangiaceae bacterium]
MKKRGATPRLVHEHRTIEMPGASMRIVVVADTHSRPHPDTAARISALAPDRIVHGGDIGDLDVLTELAKLAPVDAVRGNIDTHARDLPDVLTLDVVDDRGTLLRALVTHIAVYGPKLRAEVARLARHEDASLVLCGHSHVPFIGRDKGMTVMNPGSIGPRRFQLPIVFGVLDIDRTRIDVRHVSVETGERWAPGAATPAIPI